MALSKAEKFIRELEERRIQDAARAAQAPPPTPVQQALDPHSTIQMDRASGRAYTALKYLTPDPLQPRKYFDEEEIRQKAKSMQTEGQLQPIIVEWSAELTLWVIVDGEMRWLALQAAKIDRAWCMFKHKKMTPVERLKTQLQANCLRSGLKGVELANAIKRLMEMTNCTQQDAADELHFDRTTVTKTLQLLDLVEPIQAKIIAGTINVSVGTEIAKLDDPAEQLAAAEKIESEGMNREEAIAEVQSRKPSKGKGRAGKKQPKMVKHTAKNGCKVTVERKRTMTDDEVDAALQEMLDIRQQKRDAA